MRSENNKGFTLVEIAIVLVIIGLLMGGVLKGQELIENTKINRLLQDFRSITVAHMAYRDRMGVFPGEDESNLESGEYFADLIEQGFLKGVEAESINQYGGYDTIPHIFDSKFSHWKRGGFHVLCAEGLPKSVADNIIRNQNDSDTDSIDPINNMSQELDASTSEYFQYTGGPMDHTAVCYKMSGT